MSSACGYGCSTTRSRGRIASTLGRHGALDGADEALVHRNGIERSGAEAHQEGTARIVQARRSRLAAELVEDDLERPDRSCGFVPALMLLDIRRARR